MRQLDAVEISRRRCRAGCRFASRFGAVATFNCVTEPLYRAREATKRAAPCAMSYLSEALKTERREAKCRAVARHPFWELRTQVPALLAFWSRGGAGPVVISHLRTQHYGGWEWYPVWDAGYVPALRHGRLRAKWAG